MKKQDIYTKILLDVENKIIKLEDGFNLCLLLEKIREIYFIDTFKKNKHSFESLNNLIKYIREQRLFSIYYRYEVKKNIIKVRENEFIEMFKHKKKNYEKIRIIVCLKNNKKAYNIINKDITGYDFGLLQSLFCSVKSLDEFYKNNKNIIQLRYYIKYKKYDTIFMYQMCLKNKSFKEKVKKDIIKYKEFAKKINCKFYYIIPNKYFNSKYF